MAKSVQCSLSFSTVAQSKLCYLVNCYCNDLDIKLVFTTFIQWRILSLENFVHMWFTNLLLLAVMLAISAKLVIIFPHVCEHHSSDKVCCWCVFCRTFSLPKVQWSALQIGRESSIYILDVILGWVYDVISHLICIFYSFFKLKYLWN